MAINLGNNSITNAKLGNVQLTKIMLGTVQIFPAVGTTTTTSTSTTTTTTAAPAYRTFYGPYITSGYNGTTDLLTNALSLWDNSGVVYTNNEGLALNNLVFKDSSLIISTSRAFNAEASDRYIAFAENPNATTPEKWIRVGSSGEIIEVNTY